MEHVFDKQANEKGTVDYSIYESLTRQYERLSSILLTPSAYEFKMNQILQKSVKNMFYLYGKHPFKRGRTCSKGDSEKPKFLLSNNHSLRADYPRKNSYMPNSGECHNTFENSCE